MNYWWWGSVVDEWCRGDVVDRCRGSMVDNWSRSRVVDRCLGWKRFVD